MMSVVRVLMGRASREAVCGLPGAMPEAAIV